MLSISEFDLIFLSYDEPNAEKHYADLLDKAPWAKRVHGVKGFDAAHRACAVESQTDWFITVDADNIVRQNFFDQNIQINDRINCYSWNGLNAINGLSYGNGGLKLWRKEYVLHMATHENANDPKQAVDFCWDDAYMHLPGIYSDVYNNGSAYQAFRVGFREGVKLSLDRGERVSAEMMSSLLHPINLRNLKIWCCVGLHIEHGFWAMFGARLAWKKMCDPSWDHTVVRDYDWFQSFWSDWSAHDSDWLDIRLRWLGDSLTKDTKINLPVLMASESKFFRETI